MRTYVTTGLLMLAVVGTLGASAVFAEDGGSTPTPSPSASASATASGAIKHCSEITIAISNRTKRFDDNKARHYNKYKEMKARLAALDVKAKAAGQDTTKLEADLKTLDEKIAKFATDYTTYMNLLKDTKSYTCGHSEGQFKAKLGDARTQLAVVKADADDIQKFLKETIKPDLVALKAKLPKKSSDDTTKETEKPEASATASPKN